MRAAWTESSWCSPPPSSPQTGPLALGPGHLWDRTGRCNRRSNWPAPPDRLRCSRGKLRGTTCWTGEREQTSHTCQSSLGPCSYLRMMKSDEEPVSALLKGFLHAVVDLSILVDMLQRYASIQCVITNSMPFSWTFWLNKLVILLEFGMHFSFNSKTNKVDLCTEFLCFKELISIYSTGLSNSPFSPLLFKFCLFFIFHFIF